MSDIDIDELVQEATAIPPGQSKTTVIINGLNIASMTFPEPVWVVDGLLPVGFAILAGPPKKGKSWLALELAEAVCSGGTFIDRKARKGKTLYVALEDSPRRIQDRLNKQGWSKAALENVDFLFAADFRRMFNGKDASTLFAAFVEQSDYLLVVVDTVGRAFTIKDWNDGAQITAALSPLQEVAAAAGKLILGIDHHGKGRGFNPDPIQDVIGSIEKGGVSDTILGLYREPGKPGAKLAITGRDIEERTLELRFDAFTGRWTEVEPQDTLTDIQRETLKAIQTFAGGATLSELVQATGRNRGSLYRELQKMLDLGLVTYSNNRWKDA